MYEKFEQLNLRFSSKNVEIGDLLEVKYTTTFWKKHDYPGRHLNRGEILLIISKTKSPDWVIALDMTGEIGQVCVAAFENE